MKHAFVAAPLLMGLAAAQQVGKQQTETHPKMSWKKCSSGGSCSTVSAEVVIDANWRWLHDSNQKNCYDGNKWVSGVCSTATDCASKCQLEGASYDKTYGASTSGDGLTLKFLTKHEYGTNIGSRFYLMNGASKYQMFTLMNNEFTFDVDLSTVDCGLNAALYFVAMEEDGGMASYSSNKAGAKYGTGYCDAQCARDLKFVGGKANVEGWRSSSNDPNAGVGPMGGCCAEIDIWESNAHSFAFTPHACKNNKYHVCEDTGCGGTYSDDRFAGDCDANGCDYNPYRMGVTNFYGSGMTVDTSQKFTVVTQFIESGGSLSEINQFFVQGGKTIPMPNSTWPGLTQYNSITADFCKAQKQTFNDTDDFNAKGGFSAFSKAVSSGMVLVMSLWDDHYANMLWLDSLYPVTADASSPGKLRGPCPTSSGVPADVESSAGSSTVTYSNIRFGPIGSTTGSS